MERVAARYGGEVMSAVDRFATKLAELMRGSSELRWKVPPLSSTVQEALNAANCVLWSTADDRGARAMVLETLEPSGVQVYFTCNEEPIHRCTLPFGALPRVGERVCLTDGSKERRVTGLVHLMCTDGAYRVKIEVENMDGTRA